MNRLICIFVVLFTLVGPSHAVQPSEILDDPVLEQRARDLSAGLRCMVCQNQSIDDSDAELAQNLRVLVREQLVAGASDEEIIDYIVSRYGEFVLLQPRFNLRNALLWMAPVLLLIVGGGFLTLHAMRIRRFATPAALTQEEEHRLDNILKNSK